MQRQPDHDAEAAGHRCHGHEDPVHRLRVPGADQETKDDKSGSRNPGQGPEYDCQTFFPALQYRAGFLRAKPYHMSGQSFFFADRNISSFPSLDNRRSMVHDKQKDTERRIKR